MPQLELSRLHLSGKHLHALQTLLAEHVPDAEVWAYGSRVLGGAHEGSDLDLVLRNPSDLSQDVKGWFKLKEALQESSLPIQVDTRLWNRLPESFHSNIVTGYVVIQKTRACDGN
jgi:predicted nucleotidyltransferase